MHGRGLRSDVKRSNYASVLDAAPIGDRAALRDAAGPAALTVFERAALDALRPCRVFVTDGARAIRCDRCGHDYPAHRSAWRTGARDA